MTSRTVTQLASDITAAIRDCDFGLVAIDGELHGWRRFKSGLGIGELTQPGSSDARLKVVAGRHAAHSVETQLADVDAADSSTVNVTIHGHVVFDPRWGLQVNLLRLAIRSESVAGAPDVDRPRPNGDLDWPSEITTIGLVGPSGGDDALADVESVLSEAGVTMIEHRVSVTSPRAAILIAQALDRLALDPRPAVTLVVRGGGPVSDFAVYDDPLVGIAIDRHRHPVVTGLGHATNTTLADRAVHTSCITPTAAAQLVRQRES